MNPNSLFSSTSAATTTYPPALGILFLFSIRRAKGSVVEPMRSMDDKKLSDNPCSIYLRRSFPFSTRGQNCRLASFWVSGLLSSSVSFCIPVLFLALTVKYRTYVKKQAWNFILCYGALDLLQYYIRSTAYGHGVYFPSVFSENLWRQVTLGWAVGFRSGFDLVFPYYFCSAVAVALGLTPPSAWPPMNGSYSEAYTVRKFWGKANCVGSHWHQG